MRGATLDAADIRSVAASAEASVAVTDASVPSPYPMHNVSI